jgi:hypothetical protein
LSVYTLIDQKYIISKRWKLGDALSAPKKEKVQQAKVVRTGD